MSQLFLHLLMKDSLTVPDFNLRLSSRQALVKFDAALLDSQKLLSLAWNTRNGYPHWTGAKGVSLVWVPYGRRVLDDSDPENLVLDKAEWLNIRMSGEAQFRDLIKEDMSDWPEERKERVEKSRLRVWAEDNNLLKTRKSHRRRKEVQVYRWEKGRDWVEIIIGSPEYQRHIIL